MKKASILFRDRPRSPSEEAVYWTEYIIRHGKDALRSPSVDLKWWQVENIDVYAIITAFILLTLGAANYVVYLVFKKLIHRKKSSQQRTVTDSKKLK